LKRKNTKQPEKLIAWKWELHFATGGKFPVLSFQKGREITWKGVPLPVASKTHDREGIFPITLKCK